MWKTVKCFEHLYFEGWFSVFSVNSKIRASIDLVPYSCQVDCSLTRSLTRSRTCSLTHLIPHLARIPANRSWVFQGSRTSWKFWESGEINAELHRNPDTCNKVIRIWQFWLVSFYHSLWIWQITRLVVSVIQVTILGIPPDAQLHMEIYGSWSFPLRSINVDEVWGYLRSLVIWMLWPLVESPFQFSSCARLELRPSVTNLPSDINNLTLSAIDRTS